MELTLYSNACSLREENFLTQCVWMPHNVCMSKNINRSNRIMIRLNCRRANELWGNEIEPRHLQSLRDLTEKFRLSIAHGEVQLLHGNWYVTQAGLLRLAYRNRCSGIRVQVVRDCCNQATNRWVFKAVVYKSRGSKGFVGYGDADPSNVSSLVRGAEMRVAETRAVNRALRKAYGVGLCSVEELGSTFFLQTPTNGPKNHAAPSNGNSSANGQPRLRDKLCLLIRKYELDPNLVKRYAADFCGTETLREAGRDLVEAFVSRVAEEAASDRAALVCKLNSYSQPEEVKS